jgi:hypothetical protein
MNKQAWKYGEHEGFFNDEGLINWTTPLPENWVDLESYMYTKHDLFLVQEDIVKCAKQDADLAKYTLESIDIENCSTSYLALKEINDAMLETLRLIKESIESNTLRLEALK